jgi:hypothetical protein
VVALEELIVGLFTVSAESVGGVDDADFPPAEDAAADAADAAAALRLTVPKFCNASLDVEYVSCAGEFVVLAPTALDPGTIAVNSAPNNAKENIALRITNLLDS